MGEALIRFEGVKKAFGPKVIYEDLNLEIEAGSAFTVLGGSGVGKSVMFKMLIGLLPADGGRIIFDGRDVTHLKGHDLARLRQRIAMLFQAGALFDSLNVFENVSYGLKEHFHNKMSKREIEERVGWAL